ncbi:glycerol 3-phosphate dehydrogenase-like [Ylistrum balloti]|uniref:glycerol 3-phosphate dehydrogenase-like n=1 Tax=Ylistrum balloti TaxID=509963 RepID=UPI002905E7D1|nr:glycerol 3-phosphate dehydrogenase-like [Ylistrum balloti]
MDQVFDVVIIGGGVVGCSQVFTLSRHGYKCLLLEKEAHLVSMASSGNSGMLHTGFDAPLDSVELSCILKCQQQILPTLSSLGLPYSKIGATMVAWNTQQKEKLHQVMHRAKEDACEISLSQLYQREPHLACGATGALWIPSEAVIDPWLTPISFAHHAKTLGAKVSTSTMVQSCEQDSPGIWRICTNRGVFCGQVVINSAGLYGDVVDKLAGVQKFRIMPRMGQYLVYGSETKSLINSSILPIPTDKTKGVIVFKSVYNNVIIGPTQEETEQRTIPFGLSQQVVNTLLNHGHVTVPSLGSYPVITTYSGTRPATETKDYHVVPHTDRNWLTLGGIRSTGLSSCLGVADMVAKIMKDRFCLEPTNSPNMHLPKVDIFFTNQGTAMLGSQEYTVTHPITYTGKFDKKVCANL